MSRITIEQLGPMLKERRGGQGIRAVAADIGISAATLSRLETGKQPDLETFSKICQWLGLDAGEVLGCSPNPPTPDAGHTSSGVTSVFAHFRAEKTMKPETATRLGELILAVHRAMENEGS